MTQEPETTQHTDWSQQGHRTLLALACLIVVLTGMKLAASLMVPIALAFFLAVLSYPLIRWLVRWRVPRPLAMLLTVLLIVGTLAGLVNSGIRLIVRFQSDLPESKTALQRNIDGAAAWLEKQGIEGAAKTAKDMLNPDSIIDYLTQENVMTTIGGVLGSTFGTVAVFGGAVFMVLIVMIFILVEAHGTEGRILAIKLAGGPDLSSLMQSVSDIQKYLGIKTAISLGAGLCVGIWCWALDLQYPLLWAIIAFLFHFIPAVGAWLAAIPAIIDGLVQSGWGSAFGVAIGFVIINVSFDSFLQPMLLGRRFGMSTLVIVLSVVFWGWLWGPVGMFLAVPLTMVFKVLLDNSVEFRWLSVAMSKKKVVGTEVQLADYDLDIEDAELIGAGATTESPGRR